MQTRNATTDAPPVANSSGTLRMPTTYCAVNRVTHPATAAYAATTAHHGALAATRGTPGTHRVLPQRMHAPRTSRRWARVTTATSTAPTRQAARLANAPGCTGSMPGNSRPTTSSSSRTGATVSPTAITAPTTTRTHPSPRDVDRANDATPSPNAMVQSATTPQSENAIRSSPTGGS